MVVDIRAPTRLERLVDLHQAIAPPVAAATASQLTKPVPTQTSSLGRRVGSWSVTIAIVLGIVIGFPKLLTTVLHTPFPMAAITSGSMWPELKIGDLVFIQGVKPEQIRIGDIVVFRNETNDTFTIHRVVNLDEDTLTTKGDANFKNDQPVPYTAVVGRTLNLASNKPLHLPFLGSITVFASNLRPE